MPFVTKNPSYYFAALEEDSLEPLHVGLFLSGSITAKRSRDLVVLARGIRESSRTIRCLWIRFKNGDDSLLEAVTQFGKELAGATSISSLVFEGKAGTAEVKCLSSYLAQNDLRGIQFRRTDVDVSTFTMLRPFFSGSTTLKVLDMSGNSECGDECINEVLGALLEGGTRLETLNLGENNLDGDDNDTRRVSGDGVASIARFASKTPSLSSITLRLRHLDDIGLGELALVVRRKDCNVRRLDLSGNFGNSGVKIFAEALKTNTSLKTVSFGCHKTLDDVGGQVLMNVVDPFSQPDIECDEWENVKRSNHTLQSIYILDRPTVTLNKDSIHKLQSISTLDPHRTLQSKCWRHIEKNIDDTFHLGLETKHMPQVLSFVHQHGNLDHLFKLVRSRSTPELFTNPSPEKTRLSFQMEKIEHENEKLKKLLELERGKSENLQQQNSHLRGICHNREEAKKCLCRPVPKLMEAWKLILEVLSEPSLS